MLITGRLPTPGIRNKVRTDTSASVWVRVELMTWLSDLTPMPLGPSLRK